MSRRTACIRMTITRGMCDSAARGGPKTTPLLFRVDHLEFCYAGVEQEGGIFLRCRLGDIRQGGFRAKRETTPQASRRDYAADPRPRIVPLPIPELSLVKMPLPGCATLRRKKKSALPDLNRCQTVALTPFARCDWRVQIVSG